MIQAGNAWCAGMHRAKLAGATAALAGLLLGMPSRGANGHASLMTLDALADRLAEAEGEHASLETTYVVTTYYTGLAESREAWDARRVFSLARVHWLGHDGRVRTSRSPVGNEDVADDPHESSEMLSIWDGAAWIRDAAETNVISVYPEPRIDASSDCVAFFNCVDWPSIGGIGALSEAVRYATLLESRVEDGQGVYLLSFHPDDPSTLELHVMMSPKVRVAYLKVEIRKPLEEAGRSRLVMWVSFTMTEWKDYGGLWLPARARREGCLLGFEGGESLFGRVDFERVDARDRSDEPPSAGLFHGLQTRDGAFVVDNTAFVNYTVGDDRLLVDGVLFQVEAAIVAHPVRDLPGLLSGVWRRTGTVGRAPDQLTYRQGRPWRAMGFGGAAFVLTLVLARGLRRVAAVRRG